MQYIYRERETGIGRQGSGDTDHPTAAKKNKAGRRTESHSVILEVVESFSEVSANLG